MRVLSLDDFGLYGIGFAISLFYAGIGNSVLLTQMVVHLPDKEIKDRLPYTARMFVALVAFCFISIIIVLFILGLFNYFDPRFPYEDFSYSVLAASVAFLLKDFFIRHAYNLKKETQALAINMSLALTFMVCVSYQYFMKIHLTVSGSLWIYSISHGVSALFGFTQSKIPVLKIEKIQLIRDIKEAWVHGKWAFLQNFVFWLRSQAQTYVSALFAGVTGVGLVNASRIVITPIVFVLPAISQILIPRMAEARKTGKEYAVAIAKNNINYLLVLSILYMCFVMAFHKLFIKFVMGKKYEGFSEINGLLLVWGLVMCAQVVQNSYSSLAQALKLFRLLTWTNFISAIVAIIGSIVFYEIVGIAGVVIGAFLGEVCVFAFLIKEINT
jgi:O-antigen/teichoic acid export membrane protein